MCKKAWCSCKVVVLPIWTYRFFAVPVAVAVIVGSLRNDDGDGNENGKKAIGLDWSNSTLCIMLFLYISCRRCTTTTWKCQISRFVEDGKKRQQPSFSFPELWYIECSRIQLKKRFAKIWRSKREISPIPLLWTGVRLISIKTSFARKKACLPTKSDVIKQLFCFHAFAKAKI